ncbi:MAG: Fic family protein [Thermoplasmata archaeon]|nr:Fic family protein [Thermoplasmata archaeon]
MNTRSGIYVKQPGDYYSFIPKPLPPDPPLELDFGLIDLMSKASHALGRLDGMAENLPNPDLFVAMYVRKEAVLSSQIEGTQASLLNVLEYELAARKSLINGDVGDIVNYIAAMNLGLEQIRTEPISIKMMRNIHKRLLQNVRGSEWSPGEIRDCQNWIGPPDSNIHEAVFVPPAPDIMQQCLKDLEEYIISDTSMPALIHSAIVHAQFETIHPFLDGNGRIGRLLITLLLCKNERLSRPLLYLSFFLKKHRAEYYDRLMAVRDEGDWEGWLKFFLTGVFEVANQATETTHEILKMQSEQRELIQDLASTNCLRLHDYLFQTPLVDVITASATLDISYNAANSAIRKLEEFGFLREITGNKRNRIYVFDEYMRIMGEGVEITDS